MDEPTQRRLARKSALSVLLVLVFFAFRKRIFETCNRVMASAMEK